ncbi:glucans biosynthesis glucosyltransferase MdoH [Stella sp.]|uniref:glucans biosynthesis glucosyltransferase MdoH n=1 Tax=Stella sp. TaxID=2912054 RepID=UPI0035B162B1
MRDATMAGAGAERGITRRRMLYAAVSMASGLALAGLAAAALRPGGFDGWDAAILLLFVVTVPWGVIGFWNAAIFLWLRFTAADAVAAVAPFARPSRPAGRPAGRTAILMCVRNEDPAGAFGALSRLMADLAQGGHRDQFHAFVLSDTDRPDIAAAEEALAAAIAARHPVTYRRRTANEGFKAGNIRDFCLRWGGEYAFMVTLDTDSIMSADAIRRLVGIMEANPRFGIVQTLVTGMPSTSLFARLFQFGMRLGMRSYTLGSAAWQADCGPYWGHNAIIRVAPFTRHCHIPRLSGRPPFGGDVLSHDQIEAALMRRAGWEVRVLPEEGGSWEANPPTLVEFVRRDLRWCLGNMQYVRLVGMPGLLPGSRFHLWLAMLMFFGAPAWTAFFAVLAWRSATQPEGAAIFDPVLGPALLAIVLVFVFAPKFATAIDVLLHRDERRSFGGAPRFLAGFAAEFVFSLLLFPITTLAHTLFMLGLPFRRRAGWTGQARADHAVPWAVALRTLWRQTLAGAVGTAVFLAGSWEAWAWGQLGLAGLLLAVPFAVATSVPRLGRWAARVGFCRLPEETAPPPELVAAGLAALAPAAGR